MTIKKKVRCYWRMLSKCHGITPAPIAVRAKTCLTTVLAVKHRYIKIVFIIKAVIRIRKRSTRTKGPNGPSLSWFPCMKHTWEHCYSPMDVMLVHRRVTPQQYCMSPVPIYTPGWQETKWSKETTQFRVGPRTFRPTVWIVNRSATHASRIVSTRAKIRECPWQYKLTWILNKYQSAVHCVYFFSKRGV